jgi:hypothetical protein
MKKNRHLFRDLEILKERQRLRILQQELKIRAEFQELGDRITGKNLRNTIGESLVSNSGLALKLGFMAVNLVMERIRSRNKKKR